VQKVTIFRQTDANSPTEKIVGAQNFIFAPIFQWVLGPNFACLDDNFLTKRKLSDSSKLRGRGNSSPSPATALLVTVKLAPPPWQHGRQEPQRGPRETFSRSRSGEKIFEFFFSKWRILVYFIFLSDGGPPIVRGLGGNILPYPPLSTGLVSIPRVLLLTAAVLNCLFRNAGGNHLAASLTCLNNQTGSAAAAAAAAAAGKVSHHARAARLGSDRLAKRIVLSVRTARVGNGD